MPSKCISRDFAPSSRTTESGFAPCEALVTWSRTRMQASLRWHLTYWLIGPLLLLVTAGSFVSYRIALNAATQAYDSALLDPVLAIASHLRRTGDHLELDLPSIAIEALRIDTEDRVYYQVLGPDGELIAGTPRLPAPPERLAPEEHIFYDARLEGERVRVAARAVKAEPGTAIVQVAETLVKRDKLVLELLLASTPPQLLIAFAPVALLWFSIGQGLRPLDRLRQEIAARSPRDLRPVPEQDKPQEVRPLVGALNRKSSPLRAPTSGRTSCGLCCPGPRRKSRGESVGISLRRRNRGLSPRPIMNHRSEELRVW